MLQALGVKLGYVNFSNVTHILLHHQIKPTETKRDPGGGETNVTGKTTGESVVIRCVGVSVRLRGVCVRCLMLVKFNDIMLFHPNASK